MDALGSTDESEMQDAVLLLIRDRLVFDGKIDEKHFRFLTGKPSIVDATWLVNLSHESVDWEKSCIIAPRQPGNFPDTEWFLIELATSCLSLFGSRTSESAPLRARRTPQEVTRARGALKELFGDKIPGPDELTNKDLHKIVNDHQQNKELRLIAKDSLMRAAGRYPINEPQRK